MLRDTRILGINYNYFEATRLPKTRNGYSTYYFLLVVLRFAATFIMIYLIAAFFTEVFAAGYFMSAAFAKSFHIITHICFPHFEQNESLTAA